MATFKDSLQRQLDRTRKISIEKETELNERIAYQSKEIQRLKIKGISRRGHGRHESSFSPSNSRSRIHRDTSEVKKLQHQIVGLNRKIFKMKTEFEEERSLANSKIYSVAGKTNPLVENDFNRSNYSQR
jgi:uncharacterized small protein (DUF1192 family)